MVRIEWWSRTKDRGWVSIEKDSQLPQAIVAASGKQSFGKPALTVGIPPGVLSFQQIQLDGRHLSIFMLAIKFGAGFNI